MRSLSGVPIPVEAIDAQESMAHGTIMPDKGHVSTGGGLLAALCAISGKSDLSNLYAQMQTRYRLKLARGFISMVSLVCWSGLLFCHGLIVEA